MKVFKFYCTEHPHGIGDVSATRYYGIAAETEELAREYLDEETFEKPDKCEEIQESEWDKKIITSWVDNDFTKKPYKTSIREVMCGTDPQLVFTNDRSTF
jgi:hypothetical protein